MGKTNDRRFYETVAAILQLQVDDVTDEISPENTDTWDSLNQINLISALEQEFGVTLPIDSLEAVDSVAALKDLLAQHGVRV
ncbi:MAG: acyl carrier protein [Planctomycetota bacterium]|nr:acyl carrier protein [Planctomycetota bacterium]MCZ6697755.1 acyl carrier protein [Planctomycetota bacterium]